MVFEGLKDLAGVASLRVRVLASESSSWELDFGLFVDAASAAVLDDVT